MLRGIESVASQCSTGTPRSAAIFRSPAMLSAPSIGMPEPHDEIADLEAEIAALVNAADRCRKVMFVAKAATLAGSLLFAVTLSGLVRFGPVPLVAAITATLGGSRFSAPTGARWIRLRLRLEHTRHDEPS